MYNYWFPRLRRKVELHIRNCLKCIAYSPNYGPKEGYLHNIPKGKVPFHTLHIDHCGPMDKKLLVKQYIFVVIDAFSKYVKLYATKTTASAEAIKCLENYFTNYSRPEIIVSDRGTSFTSQDFREYLEQNDIKHVLIATGSPQANGQVERVNKVITPMLAKLVDNETKRYWYKVLEDVEYALNNTVNKSTGEAPSQVLFGLRQRGRVKDAIASYLQEYITNTDRNFDAIRDKVADRIIVSQKYNEAYVNQKRKAPHQYLEGDTVMIRNFDSTVGTSKKLIPQFKGPYKISRCLRNDRYVISDIEGCQNTQKAYKGAWQACNMRPWQQNNSTANV